MKRISVSPMFQFYVGALVTLLTVIANGGIRLPMGIPPEWGPILLSWDQFILAIYAPLGAYFGLAASSTPGPLAPQDHPLVATAQKQADAEEAAAKAGVPPPPPMLVPASPFEWPKKP